MSNEVECFLLRMLKKTRGKANKITVIAPIVSYFLGYVRHFLGLSVSASVVTAL